MGKFVLVFFILAQLEGRQNSAPASITLIPCSPKHVGADRGVSVAPPPPDTMGKKLKRLDLGSHT